MSIQSRRNRILQMAELKHGPGLEIAPLHSPIATKAEWDVRYVDIVSTEKLRDHYANDPAVPNDDIVEVDYALTGEDGIIRPLSEMAKDGAPFAWVIASHVIEHVPDLISWLEDIAGLLEDGGALVLAVPDRRYSFDAFRPQTTVGQMLLARHHGDVVPSVRAVYDHFSSASPITAREAWSGQQDRLAKARSHDLSSVLAAVEQVKDGEYVDCHVWTFKPSTFIEQINELGQLGLCEFVVEKLLNTRPGQLEFTTVLRRLPRDRTHEQDAELRGAAKKSTNDDPARFTAPQPSFTLSERERRLIERKRAIVGKARRILPRR